MKKAGSPIWRPRQAFSAASRSASYHSSGTFSVPRPVPRWMSGLFSPWKSLPPLGSRPYFSAAASAVRSSAASKSG